MRVRDANQRIVFSEARPLDAFGTVSGDVALAEDAPLGSYTVLVGAGDNPPRSAASSPSRTT